VAVSPKLPNLAPTDMAWARWVTNQLSGHDSTIEQLVTRAKSANVQRGAVAGAGAKTQANGSYNPFAVQMPSGLPQTPTAPQLGTDHATVTVRWDGQILYNGVIASPAIGFSHVFVQRSTDNITFANIGTRMGLAGTLVDSDVVVGQKYFYRLITTDTLNRTSAASEVSSITVKGVDLGSLDQDVHDALDAIEHAATTGGLVVYSATQPSDPKYHNASALWFDISDPKGAVANRWDDTANAWAPVPYGTGALGPGSVTASKILAGEIDTYHLGAGIITSDKIDAGAITTEKLSAGSVVTEKIAVAAIDADRIAVGAVNAKTLSLGAIPHRGTQTNRVPHVMTDLFYWTSVIDGSVVIAPHAPRPTTNATATASGIVFTGGFLAVTAENPIPDSRQIHTSWTQTGNLVPKIVTYDGNFRQLQYTSLPNGGVFMISSTAMYYTVVIDQPSTLSSTLTQISVFEVIGGEVGSQQAAQLSPSGLRLFNDAGQLSVDLSTSTKNFFTILNDDQAVLTLDEDGNGSFNAVQANDDYYYGGYQLVGGFADNERADGTLDGPLLDRLPRGVHYAATWATMNEVTVNTRYKRIATGSFSLGYNRTYMLNVDLGGLQTTDSSGINAYVELQLTTTPLSDVSSGTPVMRAVVYNTDTGYYSFAPAMFTTPLNAPFSVNARTLPPGTDIYWQLNTNLSDDPTTSYKFNQYTNSAGFTILDMGPAIEVLDGTDRTTTGAPATGSAGSGSGSTGSGSGTGTSTTTTKTKTWDATWSASWNQGGASRVSGSGTYTDANRLYQGFGASNMGAKIGFPSSVASTLAGKTVTKVELFVQNRWTYLNAGGTATFAGHGNSSAGSTFGSTTGDTFTRHFDRGQGRWLNLANGDIPFSAWKSGSVRGVALTVQGGSTNYAYYDGVGKSKPPKLRITYK
jgi:hypothetical protein